MRLSIAIPAALAAALLGAAAAQAFTIQNYTGGNANDPSRFTDPDEQAPMQRLTDPSRGPRTGFSSGGTGYSYTSPNGFSLSITRQPESGFGSHVFDPTRDPASAPIDPPSR